MKAYQLYVYSSTRHFQPTLQKHFLQGYVSHDDTKSSSPSKEARSKMHSGSFLGPDLLSQLAELNLNAAELERNHPSPSPVPTACQVRQPSSRQHMRKTDSWIQPASYVPLQSIDIQIATKHWIQYC